MKSYTIKKKINEMLIIILIIFNFIFNKNNKKCFFVAKF